MEMALDSESDFSEVDEETDRAVLEYLNDTLAESVHAKQRSSDLIYTSQQLEDIALYKKAIALNREAEATYKKLEDSLYKMLKEVRQRLKDNETALCKETIAANEGGFSYLRSGKPYFKDKNNFTPPDNEDTIMMRQAQMYDFSQVSSVPGWTVKDKTELVNALQELSRDIRKKELKSEIARLRRENEKDNVVEIARLEGEITQLHKKSLMEIALPLDQEYDWEALANSLNRRHTAQEYQALWKLFFHPSINKSNWSKAEHQQLQKIASAFNMQNWDMIAKKLNTGRTGYQCFVYYRTNMVDVSSNRRWTPEEIEYLQRVIDYFREGTYIPWGKVATAMDNRTKIQVYNKYTRMMEHRKGRFLEEEDVVLLNCHEKYGDDFKKISEFLPGRSAVQLRTRFNLLTKFRVSKTWTIQDDKKLIQIMANQESNSNFSTATAYFPGMDRMHIRSRYITLMKWMKAHPATDISMAPRRGARRLVHGHAVVNLNEAVANLNKRIETEVKTKKTKRITKFSREKDIDDAIMAALINEIIKEEAYRKLDGSEIDEISSPFQPTDEPPQSTSNLRKLLIFFNSCLDQTKFQNSKYAAKYPDLQKTAPGVSLLKVKSYSKTQSVKTFQMDESPDIWGNVTLGTPSYVLPPNYATLTGCRVLMKNCGSVPDLNPEDEVNLSLMARKNPLLKESLSILKERFMSLFLWPILLSNETPSMSSMDQIYVPKPKIEQKFLPQPNEVTIPPTKKTYLLFQAKQNKNVEDENSIDIANVCKQDKTNTTISSGLPMESNEILAIGHSLDSDSD